MDHQEFYDKFVNPRLKKIEENIEKALKVIVGDNDNPQVPGVLERLRNIESNQQCLVHVPALVKKMNTIEKRHKKTKKFMVWAGGIIGGFWLYSKAPAIINFISETLRLNGKN